MMMEPVNSVRALICLIAIIGVQVAQGQSSRRSGKPEEEISYTYRLTTSQALQLCEHMGSVFNANFRKIWVREPVPLADTASPYSPDGRFAFPRVGGIEHDRMKTFDMALSKLPSSPEFDAIAWEETRVTTGAPAGVQIPESSRPLAALIAYFDFDNDGRKDTVLKYGFTRGYEAIRDRAESAEYLSVWRSKTKEVRPNASLWALANAVGADRPIAANGQYLRPFMYEGRAYVAKYEMRFSDFESGKLGPYQISKETMTILDLRDTGAHVELTRMPVWTETAVCQFEMTRTN
jgi:hypothetical protein